MLLLKLILIRWPQIQIPTETKKVTLTSKGDGRMLVGVRVLTERRRRSKRGPGGGFPVTIRMEQSRDAASGMIRQTVTIT